MSSRRPAQFDFPKPDAIEKLVGRQTPPQPPTATDPGPAGDPPSAWWDSVLDDPRAAGRPGVPIECRRLSEIPRSVLRVECLKCFRIIEIQRLDAIKLYGPHVVWKEVGSALLDDSCQHRTGNRDQDGCWPTF
jgi:hypothetical protein